MTMLDTAPARRWQNSAGTQEFVGPVLAPADEDQAIAMVQDAVSAGRAIRAVGSGHSFSPIVGGDHALIDVTGLSGVLSIDRESCTAEVLAGTTLSDLGPALWREGVALKNQGEIDAQTIAGAVATATHGSGIHYGSLSSTVRGVTLITGSGDVIAVDGASPDALRAAQVSIGLLGVVTRLTLDVAPAYRLREHNKILSLDDTLSAWDELLARYRHFGFFWCPTDRSAAMYALPPIPANHCLVKLLEELPADPDDDDRPLTGETGSRTGRSYLIYPDCSDDASSTVELEYMVDAADARDAFLALRNLMQTDFPEAISPIEVRWQHEDSAFLSPQYGRDSASLSVSGEQHLDYRSFLQSVHNLLQDWRPRPHWGKMHYFDNPQLRKVLPELDRFLEVRDAFDPDGLFLNNHLRDILAVR